MEISFRVLLKLDLNLNKPDEESASIKCLKLILLEIHSDPQAASQKMCTPEELANDWYENALNLANIKSKKRKSTFI